MTMVDDCHAVGFMGPNRAWHARVSAASWAASTSSRARSARPSAGHPAATPSARMPRSSSWLRQRSRPYLFSNTLAPVIAATRSRCSTCSRGRRAARARLHANAPRTSASSMSELGFDLLPGEGHPIIPVMLGDARLATEMADRCSRRASTSSASATRSSPSRRGPHPHPDERGPHPRPHRPGRRRLRRRRTRAGRYLVKALVKSRGRPSASGCRTSPGPGDRPERRPDRDHQDRHLRHRHPHLQLGRLGPATPSPCR